jgi:hypothetical protein
MIVLPGFVMSFNANRSDISGDSSESMVEGDCIDVLFHTRVMRCEEEKEILGSLDVKLESATEGRR